MKLNTFTILDQPAIDEIRRATVAWYDCEAGAPAIHPRSPMIELLEDGYADHLDAFMRACSIETGRRSFPNPMIGMPPYSRYDHGIPPGYFVGDRLKETIEIDVTERHLVLLANLSIDLESQPERPRFNPKRVFNDYRDPVMGAYVAINGRPENSGFSLSEEQHAEYAALYEETAAALQVLLREATVEPGIYLSNLVTGFRKVRGSRDYDRFRELSAEFGQRASRAEYLDGLVKFCNGS